MTKAVSTAGKYHIGSSGIPTICKAQKNCPFSSDGHFETYAEAAEVSNIIFQDKYGMFGTGSDEKVESRRIESSIYKIHSSNPNSKMNQIDLSLNNGKRVAGQKTEIFASVAYADEMGLNHFSTYNSDGQLLGSSSVSDDEVAAREMAYHTAQDKIIEKYSNMGVELKNPEKLIKAIHYSDDGETSVVLMGSSNVLDMAIVKDDKVELVEVKSAALSGAQLPEFTLSANEDGMITGTPKEINPFIQQRLQSMKMDEAFGTNKAVPIPEASAMHHFIDSYKKKGADKLVYMPNNGTLVEVPLQGNTDAIANTLNDNHLQVLVKVRTNQVAGVPNKQDKKRWENLRGNLFNNGKFPSDKFTMNDLTKDARKQVVASGAKKCKIGEVVFPVSLSEFKQLPKDHEFDVASLRVTKVQLLGTFNEKPQYMKNK